MDSLVQAQAAELASLRQSLADAHREIALLRAALLQQQQQQQQQQQRAPGSPPLPPPPLPPPPSAIPPPPPAIAMAPSVTGFAHSPQLPLPLPLPLPIATHARSLSAGTPLSSSSLTSNSLPPPIRVTPLLPAPLPRPVLVAMPGAAGSPEPTSAYASPQALSTSVETLDDEGGGSGGAAGTDGEVVRRRVSATLANGNSEDKRLAAFFDPVLIALTLLNGDAPEPEPAAPAAASLPSRPSADELLQALTPTVDVGASAYPNWLLFQWVRPPLAASALDPRLATKPALLRVR